MEHCQCDSKLSSALTEHSCCQATWAKPICENTCLQVGDCESAEAKECASACAHDHCVNIREVDLSQTCDSVCFQGDCAKYKTCPPVKVVNFDYICENGEAPLPNGCCWHQDCPALCEDRHFYIMEVAHGEYRNECQCHGCPANVSHQNDQMTTIVMANVKEIGEKTISDICRMVGLDYATQRMLEMMKIRNDKIEEAIEGHSDVWDASLDATVQGIAEEWNRQIYNEAQKAAACRRDVESREDCNVVLGLATTPATTDTSDDSQTIATSNLRSEDRSPAPSSSSGSEKDDKDGPPVVPIIIGCTAVVLCAVAAATLVCVAKGRRSSKGGNNNNAQTAQTTESEDVVVGRPVEGDAEQAAPSGGVVVPPPAEKDQF